MNKRTHLPLCPVSCPAAARMIVRHSNPVKFSYGLYMPYGFAYACAMYEREGGRNLDEFGLDKDCCALEDIGCMDVIMVCSRIVRCGTVRYGAMRKKRKGGNFTWVLFIFAFDGVEEVGNGF